MQKKGNEIKQKNPNKKGSKNESILAKFLRFLHEDIS